MEQTWTVGWVAPGIMGSCSNPVTGRMIALDPMIEVWSEEAFVDLFGWVLNYCQAADAMPGRLDPVVIDASGWRDDGPVVI